MTVVKISDVILQDVTSEQSSASSRVTINENFHKLRATLVSAWETLDSISNILTGSGLGSIDLHSDVSTAGVNAPATGQVLGWDGTQWKPVNTVAGAGLINYLYELTDVENFTYPMVGKKVLYYDPVGNLWKTADFNIYSLDKVDFTNDSNISVIYKKANGNLDAANAGAANTFLMSTGSGLIFSLITLGNLSGIVLPVAPVLSQKYVLQYNGADYQFVNESLGQGIKNHILTGETIVVPVDYQYIVHNELILDGNIEVEGELVIL